MASSSGESVFKMSSGLGIVQTSIVFHFTIKVFSKLPVTLGLVTEVVETAFHGIVFTSAIDLQRKLIIVGCEHVPLLLANLLRRKGWWVCWS